MESLYILIPLAVLIVALAVWVFSWAVKNGQFEDLDTEGKRILFDERPPVETQSTPPPNNVSHSSKDT